MRMFLRCQRCHKRIYIGIYADTKAELLEKMRRGFAIDTHTTDFEVECRRCYDTTIFTVNDIHARRVDQSIATLICGSIAGGLVGGPLGMLAGAAAGYLFGICLNKSEQRKADKFNRSGHRSNCERTKKRGD